MAVEEFVHKTLQLLDKERDAEIEETQSQIEKLSAKELERRGVCLLKLQLRSRRSGLYGRMVAVFEPEFTSKSVKVQLPSHNFTPGDIVGVGFMKGEVTDKPLATGIVSQVMSSSISVAFDESQDILDLSDDDVYKLTKLANDVTYKRLKASLNELLKYRGGPTQNLIDALFNLQEISTPMGDFPITFVNKLLDESQREAVKFSLTQREVAIIHGPPGTGKTTTVVELIVQAVRQGLKVLAAAPSNIAVDNLVERLANHKQKIVRIGHPARLLTHLQKFSLDAIVAGSEATGIIKDVKTDIQNILNKLKKTRSSGERQALREEMKQLRKETTRREEAATKDVLSRAHVVLATLTSATNDGPLKHLREDHFDLVVIDECSQALEAACWIGLLKARRCVLAGDHLQLPPTILSKEAAVSGLEETLMERLLKMLVEEKQKDVMRMLTVQYRMHEDIMNWASQQLYQGKLTAHQSVAGHLLRDLDGVQSCDETSTSLLLIDTTGCDLFELDLPDEVSKGNEGEADIVAAHVEDLIKFGVRPADIAVISPYNLQVELLRVRLSTQHPDLEVKSVDGFQGREKEAVVISMVRSNKTGEVGFLAEKRRINVAVTRARRHLAVVCDVETVSHDTFIKSLTDYMTEKGDLLSAHQFIHEGRVNSLSTRPARLSSLMGDTKSSGKNLAGRSKPVKTSTQQPQQSKDEKVKIYKQQLEKFMSDPGQSVIHFPASLNSHDRMVIHEVAGNLGLTHVSSGEGKDRHIQVSKLKVEGQHAQQDSATSSPLVSVSEMEDRSTDPEPTKDRSSDPQQPIKDRSTDPQSSQEAHDNRSNKNEESSPAAAAADCQSLLSTNKQTQSAEQPSHTQVHENFQQHDDDETKDKLEDVNIEITKPDTASGKHRTLVTEKDDTKPLIKEKDDTKPLIKEKDDKKPLIKEKDDKKPLIKEKDDKKPQTTEICKLCQKNILVTNFTLHQLHCSKQGRAPPSPQVDLSTACSKQRTSPPQVDTSTASAKQKDSKQKEKKKDKTKKSHVQKAANILNKIDDEDFDGLIASITELDSKCAFKKCKILTNTLGRNCEFCTRRFCLTHLMPEVHGCGEAVKSAARRVISRDGVLHSGSGVPNRKPSQARRAQLESKMEKKLGELAGKRARNV